MTALHEVRHVSVSIARSPRDVYAFASNPENLPRWATGLAGTIANVDGEWIADAPAGKVKVRFAGRNELGVLDHDVVLETGETIHVSMRVVPNGDGSEVVFTLVRQPGVSDERFAEDARWVQRDLNVLKRLLER
ncbi:SRPBCC family protein [Anaeromyxobacter terrae]|uniref:SRPBCC family protein n=1 Tax=Anaeromyxobacter terrae TaxID=2925406 RepID=UPI001F59105A|nr:SRPBCC family protein [Anaeromyxobacter sp. SG22]